MTSRMTERAFERNRITPHLTFEELACKDGTPYPAEWLVDRALPLALEFEAIRSICDDRPIIVLSGYRTEAHNRRVGGARASQHLQGRALDIRVKGKSVGWLENRVRVRQAMPDSLIRGIGIYPSFIHFDIRPTERLAVWGGSRIKADAPAR